MGSIQVYSRFQLEATKLGRNVVFQVTVFEKKERSKSRLFAETQISDPLQHMIHFIIRDAPDLDAVIQRFQQQLLHRGFVPLQYRVKNGDGSWAPWTHLDLDDAIVGRG